MTRPAGLAALLLALAGCGPHYAGDAPGALGVGLATPSVGPSGTPAPLMPTTAATQAATATPTASPTTTASPTPSAPPQMATVTPSPAASPTPTGPPCDVQVFETEPKEAFDFLGVVEVRRRSPADRIEILIESARTAACRMGASGIVILYRAKRRQGGIAERPAPRGVLSDADLRAAVIRFRR